MERQPPITLPAAPIALVAALAVSLLIGAGAARAGDPCPPPDAAGQKALEDARRQMRSEGISRRLYQERRDRYNARYGKKAETEAVVGNEPPSGRR